ncbi:hypothetical protein PHLCEN_2v4989 [Hermanssonia centrifuga]|uniref:Uncharacterized protein n=1 Tax=Hermanssonia centrifuga TaxID=98765 RepID=A0A2R6PC19_9APHY|nr:hypothetical protein PHLCEN_2v4989 [Hermanssonia centrifuga]
MVNPPCVCRCDHKKHAQQISNGLLINPGYSQDRSHDGLPEFANICEDGDQYLLKLPVQYLWHPIFRVSLKPLCSHHTLDMLDLNGFQVYLRLRSGYTVAHDPATVERLGTTVFADVKVTRQVTSIANEDTSKQSASISDQASESSADELEDECTSNEPASIDADARLSPEIPLALSLKRSRSHLSEAVPKPKRLRRDTISNPENNGEDEELHIQTERLIEEYRQVEDEGVRLENLVYHALNDKIQARRVRNKELSALASKFECKQED